MFGLSELQLFRENSVEKCDSLGLEMGGFGAVFVIDPVVRPRTSALRRERPHLTTLGNIGQLR